MDRTDWEKWRAANGIRKRRLEGKLLADNEALVQYYVAAFSKHSNYYTDNMKDDLLQAARIGVIRALPAWDPDKGGFSAVAYWWATHEMQLVVRHATGVSVPKSAFLPKAKQDEAARFYALHGRDPTPEEIGVTEAVMERARKATATFVDFSDAENVACDPMDMEERIDRERDTKSLTEFIRRLSAKDRREFWSGGRPDLTERAKRYVEEKRGNRGRVQ